MRYSCTGVVDSTLPESTRPGCERQASCAGFAVELSVVGEEGRVCWGGNVGGFGVEVRIGVLDGEQAVMKASSVQSIHIGFVA